MGQGIEVERTAVERVRQAAERRDLYSGQASLLQGRIGRHEKRRWREWSYSRVQPVPNRCGARDRELLTDDDAGEALEAGRAAAKRQDSRTRVHAREVWAGAHQRR